MSIDLSLFGTPRIKDMQPGDISRLQQLKQRKAKIDTKKRAISKEEAKLRNLRAGVSGQAVGRSVRSFAQAGLRQEVPFSVEQEALRGMFGGGDHIWGTEMEPVKLYNDLNPRQRGDTGTAECFGLNMRGKGGFGLW